MFARASPAPDIGETSNTATTVAGFTEETDPVLMMYVNAPRVRAPISV